MSRSPQKRSSSMLPGCFGENSFCTLARFPSPSTSMRDLDLFDARVGDSDGTHEAVILQRLQTRDDVAVHERAVGAVVLVQLDLVDAEDVERLLDRRAQVRRRPVADLGAAFAQLDAALRRDEDARRVAVPGAQRLGDDALVVPHLLAVRGVDVGGVDEGDAGVERGMHGGHRILERRILLVVVHRQGHGSEPDRRNLSSCQRALLHRISLSHGPSLPGLSDTKQGLDNPVSRP